MSLWMVTLNDPANSSPTAFSSIAHKMLPESPPADMFVVTICALAMLAYKRLGEGKVVLGAVAVLLLALAVVLLVQALKKLREVKAEPPAQASAERAAQA